MNFIRNIFHNLNSSSTLEELIVKNSNPKYLGRYRKRIINKLSKQVFICGTNQKVADQIIKNISLLTTSSPDGEGFVLITFLNQKNLTERNPNAYPIKMDIYALYTSIDSSDLQGLLIQTDNGWIAFAKDELKKYS